MEVDGSGLSQMYKSAGDEAVIARLRETLEDVNQVKSDGTTLLHLFSMLGSYKVVQYLWDHGAKPTVLTLDNSTVLHSTLRNNDDKEEARAKILELFLRGQRDRECESSGVDSPNADLQSVFKPLDINHRNEKGWTALKVAARKKMEKCVDVLIRYDADPDLCDNEKYTPLHNSVESPAIMKLLALKCSNINACNDQGETALYVACDRGHSAAALILLERKADPNISDNSGISPLFIAARNGNQEIVRSLIKSGADVNKAGGTQMIGPLHWAAHKEIVSIAVLLIEHGGDVLLQDNEGRTPLSMASPALAEKMIATAKRLNPAFDQGQGPAGMSAKEKAMTACCGGNVPALAALLRSGEVTVNMRCSKTQQPLIHTAAYCGQVGVVMYLLQEGADLKLLDSENDTVLHFACMKTIPQGRHDTTLEFLLSTVEGSKLVNSQNNSGDTPLLVAVKCGFVSRALLMLKYKADPLVGNHKKELPLHRACGDNDNMELVMSLVEVTDINTKDGDGWTPLMFACKGSSQFMVRYLLQRGADPNIPQSMGFTALYLAAQEDNPHICEMLLDNGANPNVQGGPQKLSPLHLAAHSNHLAVCCVLALKGADIYMQDIDGDTPLSLGNTELKEAILSAHKKWIEARNVSGNSQPGPASNHNDENTEVSSNVNPDNTKHLVRTQSSVEEPDNEQLQDVGTLKEKMKILQEEVESLQKENLRYSEELAKLQTSHLSTSVAMISLSTESSDSLYIEQDLVQKEHLLYKTPWKTVSYGWFGEVEVCVTESGLYKTGTEFAKALTLLRQLHSPYLASFLGIFTVPDSNSHGIVMECMDLGPLCTFIENKQISATWKHQLRMVLDVACGLCYVHSQGLVYKHLQPLYVLLSQHLRAKLSVEGFLVDCMDDPRTLQGTDVTDNSVSTLGTSENLYQAPEVMDGSVSHSKSSDVYSFSLVMYEIACRQYMYDGEDGCEQDAFKIAFKAMMGSRPVFSSNIPPSFVDLATRSWQKEQASRPSLPSVVQELKDMLSKCV